MNTSLTESFGIAILEAACAGLYVVSTRVGGVPEILPQDMISFAEPDADGMYMVPLISYEIYERVRDYEADLAKTFFLFIDVFRAISEAIAIVAAGKHNPIKAHERVKTFYDWRSVASRTEKVYTAVMQSSQMELMERIQRYVEIIFTL